MNSPKSMTNNLGMNKEIDIKQKIKYNQELHDMSNDVLMRS